MIINWSKWIIEIMIIKLMNFYLSLGNVSSDSRTQTGTDTYKN